MKKEGVLVVLMLLFTSIILSQKKEEGKKGTLSVSIKSLPYNDLTLSDGSSVGKIFVKSKDIKKEIPYVKRIITKDTNVNDESYVDVFKINLPVGIYRIVLDNSWNFKFPLLVIQPNKTAEVIIPEGRFGYDEVCNGSNRILKTYSSEESEKLQKKRYKKYPYKNVSTEIFVAKKPFDVVIQHCGKRKVGNGIEYLNARFFYQNTFIGANRLIINKKKLTVEATGIETEPALLQSGSLESEKKKIFFNLKTNKEVIKEP
jgi:hypothetical protein